MNINDLKILVVEDETFQRNILIRILSNMGLTTIYEALDGNSALEFLKKQSNHPDIIICDINMPSMDGMELIRNLSQRKKKIAIIIASGLEHALVHSIETMALAYSMPILGIIEKPVSRDKLAILFQKYLLTSAPKKPAKLVTKIHEFTTKELDKALKNEEFEPFFQPKVEMITGFIKGVESLARWRHQKYGLLPPIHFINQMESHGLIENLTWNMLKKTSSYCKIWQENRLNINVSINISTKSLTNANFADHLTNFTIDQGLAPSQLTFEITESATTTDTASLLENLSRLRMKGFGLSIDDYGTGYSTMQQLMKIAFTELKIDRSFVTNVATNEFAQVALESSLDLAKKLNIISVAEGVETQDDWDYLLAHGCDIAQGYFIARPMPADLFYKWAMEWMKKITLKGV